MRKLLILAISALSIIACTEVNRKVAYRCHRLDNSNLKAFHGVTIQYFDSAYMAGDTINPYDDDEHIDYFVIIERVK